MNREIKFRAWRLNRMWYPDDLKNDDGQNQHFKMDFDGKIVRMWDNQGLNNQFELMQFTGLKDKNGKEIYEGDIVQHYDKLRYPVEYRDGMFCLPDGHFSIKTHAAHIEVIGNIWENGSLLDNKNP